MSGVLGAVTTTIPGLSTGGAIPGFSTGSTQIPTPSVGSSGSGIVDSTLGLSSLAGALIEVVAVAAVFAAVGIVIIAVVANRAEPDPTGRRPHSVYFFVVSYVTITTAITGSAFAVAALLVLTAHHSSAVGHVTDRLLLVSLLIMLVSLLVLGAHLRRGLALARTDDSPSGPSRRVGQSYVSVVAFVSILVVLAASVVAIYMVFAIAAPGTFGSIGGRGWAARVLVESLYLVVVAAVVIWRHSSLLAPGLGILSGKVTGPGEAGSVHPGEPPTPRPLG
ncbi:MAG: hypothetical protein ABSF84_02200 [Acidimicrobiales bacterium]